MHQQQIQGPRMDLKFSQQPRSYGEPSLYLPGFLVLFSQNSIVVV